MRTSMIVKPMAITAMALIGLVACSNDGPPQAESATNTPVATASDAMPTPTNAPATPPGNPSAVAPAKGDVPAFADRVWRVVESTAVAAGTTYTFLADGTLMIDAPGGTPASGHWDYRDQQLTMVEEGISYPVEIVRLDANRFTIRSHNPGGAVTISMQSAPDEALPELQ